LGWQALTMSYVIGRTHYVDFRVVDLQSNPIAGLHLSDFVVVFTRDNVTTGETLTLTDLGGGRYSATYLPANAGFYYLELYHVASDIRVIDEQEIDAAGSGGSGGESSSSVSLSQDYGGIGALRPVFSNPQNYVLYIFRSQDWQNGHMDSSYAVTLTELDSSGNWLSSPLLVIPGTYHVVCINSSIGDTRVIRAFLEVTL
jgi:hypothetical protein